MQTQPYRKTYGTDIVRYPNDILGKCLTSAQRQFIKDGDTYFTQKGIILDKSHNQIKFQMFIRNNSNDKCPQYMVVIQNKEYEHILVKLDTGRLFIPLIKKSDDKDVQFKQINDQVLKYITMALPPSFESMKSANIYPVNLSLWSQHVNRYKFK